MATATPPAYAEEMEKPGGEAVDDTDKASDKASLPPAASIYEADVVDRAMHTILADPDAAYVIPIYTGDDGGHDRRVVKWFKKEGELLEAQEALCEIETTEVSYSCCSWQCHAVVPKPT